MDCVNVAKRNRQHTSVLEKFVNTSTVPTAVSGTWKAAGASAAEQTCSHATRWDQTPRNLCHHCAVQTRSELIFLIWINDQRGMFGDLSRPINVPVQKPSINIWIKDLSTSLKSGLNSDPSTLMNKVLIHIVPCLGRSIIDSMYHWDHGALTAVCGECFLGNESSKSIKVLT